MTRNDGIFNSYILQLCHDIPCYCYNMPHIQLLRLIDVHGVTGSSPVPRTRKKP
uniref:Uncharacterized protein n=1 Tax=Siphoviridae sp. ctnhN1 TaxID=2827589 RepID=A0A8S5LKR5_9CAUD|nr:MAG TPA: hypothetical protein [Siphoviridae sp. ctnhN1]